MILENSMIFACKNMNKIIMHVFLCGLLLVTDISLKAESPLAQSVRKLDKPDVPPAKYIVKDCIAQGKIYLPANSERAMLFAAQELREHLKKITGADVESAWCGLKPGGSGFVFKTRPESEWRGKESAQAFTIEESASPMPLVTITGNTSLAVLYGVYQYLNDLGVRWLTPGEIGINIPRLSDIPINIGKHTYSPSFSSRTLALSSTADNHFGGTPNIKSAVYDYELYLIRNRTQLGRNIATKDFSFDLCGTASGHAIKPMTGLTQDKVKELMEKEPERFALVTGKDFTQKRVYDDGQVCFSNEKNIQTAIENCISYFAKLDNTRNERSSDLDEDCTVPMGLSDCFGYCECVNCAKIAGKEPNSKDRLVWSFWNRVAKGLNEKMPGRKMAVFYPYMNMTEPPADVKIEPNIMAVTCMVIKWEKAPENQESYPFTKRFLQNISRIRDAGAGLGCYDYQNFPWTPTPLHVLDAAQGYAKLGYKHYHMEAMQRTEYDWPIIWSLAQFTWDSTKNPREYLKDFCREYYGTPCDADILWLLEEMTRNACGMERINYGGGSDTSYMLPDELIKNARIRLTAATRNSQGRQQERLMRFRDSIEAQFQLAETYRAYCKALNNRTTEDITDFVKRANGLKDYWQKNNMNVIYSNNRNPPIAAALYLKTDFANLKPSASKELAGKGPQDERWLKELFAGAEKMPEKIPDLFPLPELWKFHIDYGNKGVEKGYFKIDYDDSKGWPMLSSWNMPSFQGYNSQVGGYFWYRLKFKAPLFPVGKKILLRIGSLDDTGDVYLNGVKVGSQSDPLNWDKSFVMDVSKEIKPGEENVLAIHGYDCGGGEGVWRPSALYTDN
jgi:hypothetical protein